MDVPEDRAAARDMSGVVHLSASGLTHLRVVGSFSIPITTPSVARQSSIVILPSITVATSPDRETSMSVPPDEVGKTTWSRRVWVVMGSDDVCGQAGSRSVACRSPEVSDLDSLRPASRRPPRTHLARRDHLEHLAPVPAAPTTADLSLLE